MESVPQQKGSLLRSAGVVSSATLVSRVLGLVREQVTAYLFGAGDMVDAFKSAFRVPNLLRDMFAEGALSAGFIPIFSEKLRVHGKDEAMRFAGMVFGALTAVVSMVVLLMIALTPEIAHLIAEGFEDVPGKLADTIQMARVMMPFLLLISLAAMLMGVLNSFGRFFVPALAPALLNLGMIICGIALSPVVDPPVMSLAIGVLAGGFAQFLMQYIALRKSGFRFQLVFDLMNPDLLRLFMLILPTTIGLAATQINVAIINRLASTDSGAVSYLDYAFRLLHLPLGLFAVAIATVALPRLSSEAAAGNVDEFSKIHSSAIRLGLFLSVPTMAIMLLLSTELCAGIFQYGKFTAFDSEQTGNALAMYAIGLPFFTLVRITVPAFYAVKDTRTPAIVSIFSVAVNIFLCFQLRDEYGFIGLALAASIAGVVNLTALTYLLRKRVTIEENRHVMIGGAKIILASAMMAAAIWASRTYITGDWLAGQLHHLVELILLLVIAVVVYLAFCYLLRIEEWHNLSRGVIRRIRGR